eukprot:gb/GEZN01014742.1/.p1 GENE.gb/GEZN01014742.1/~~gb/GEZN01014742.1/.p1  ORF type:complete len:139 (-),score=20.15 gb/GEZN01014742.1/:447-863(-)
MSSQDACATTSNQADHLATLLRYLDAILRYLQRMDKEQIFSRLGLRQTSFGRTSEELQPSSSSNRPSFSAPARSTAKLRKIRWNGSPTLPQVRDQAKCEAQLANKQEETFQAEFFVVLSSLPDFLANRPSFLDVSNSD